MDKPMDMESLRARLRAMSHSEVLALAIKAGLSGATVVKIRSGYTEDPRISNVQALINALQDEPKARKPAKAI